jgi:hypothetical protein
LTLEACPAFVSDNTKTEPKLQSKPLSLLTNQEQNGRRRRGEATPKLIDPEITSQVQATLDTPVPKSVMWATATMLAFFGFIALIFVLLIYHTYGRPPSMWLRFSDRSSDDARRIACIYAAR